MMPLSLISVFPSEFPRACIISLSCSTHCMHTSELYAQSEWAVY